MRYVLVLMTMVATGAVPLPALAQDPTFQLEFDMTIPTEVGSHGSTTFFLQTVDGEPAGHVFVNEVYFTEVDTCEFNDYGEHWIYHLPGGTLEVEVGEGNVNTCEGWDSHLEGVITRATGRYRNAVGGVITMDALFTADFEGCTCSFYID